MKTCFAKLIFFALIFSCCTLSGQNNALDFDGDGDYVTLNPINLWTANTDFTVEAWFTAVPDGQVCNNNFRRLIAFSGPDRFEVGQCGGDIVIFWTDPTSHGPFIINTNVEDGNWHCIGVVRSGSLIEIYLDGTLIYTFTTAGTINTSLFRVGHWGGGNPTAGQDWLGQIDEVRLWNKALPSSELLNCPNCLLTGSDPNLIAYWQFDQGIPSGNNTSITQAVDATANGNNGTLHPSTATPDPGFILDGSISSTGNFVSSGAPLVYPNYTNLSLFISDLDLQFPTGLVTICDGDPVHFALTDINGNVPQPASGVSVAWEYSDNGNPGPWNATTLTGFQFVVPANDATAISCPANTGFVDRDYRAIITVTNVFGTCIDTSLMASLHICCKVNQATVSITPSGPLCEGDVVTFNVSVATNLPAPFSTNDVHIDWCMTIGQGPVIQLPMYYDMPAFTYPIGGPYVVGTSDICFIAKISNCTCPPLSGQACVKVDPKPVCGSIIGWPTPTTLTQVATSPWLTYEICPGDDAAIGIDQNTSFLNCNPQWQYSFTPTILPSWIPLGFSNPIQNTNILPTTAWGTNTSIFYQIKCLPLSNPSGCDSCLSNIIEIKLKPLFPKPVIVSVPPTQTICKGSTLALYTTNTPGTTSTWYCNGAIIGTGATVTVSNQACYWVEATDGCYTLKSDTFCVNVCTAVAIIKCPEDNPCVIPNVPITLSGLLSWSTCGAIVQYDWEVEDAPAGSGPIQHFSSNSTVTFTPPTNGSIITLCVTDVFGCTHCTQAFIKPCQP